MGCSSPPASCVSRCYPRQHGASGATHTVFTLHTHEPSALSHQLSDVPIILSCPNLILSCPNILLSATIRRLNSRLPHADSGQLRADSYCEAATNTRTIRK